tara:strand:- start:370 stop:501 length:132 start_codon:yes stop_codon:yes gene_type:complete
VDRLAHRAASGEKEDPDQERKRLEAELERIDKRRQEIIELLKN